jgi:hypothetical protein
MTWPDIFFITLWGALGLWAWIRGFGSWFRWWLTSGIVDKIMMGLVLLVTITLSLVFGPFSFVCWRTNDPRNYR